MKKVMYLVVLLTGLSAAAITPPDVNDKVIKAFNETFVGAKEVSWNQSDDKYQADFKMSEIRVSATYDAEGNLLKTIRYYYENNLPPKVLAKVKKKQAGKEIFGVTEIVTDEEIAYHIVLKDENNWYWIKSDSFGNQSLTKKLKRGEPRASGF